MPIAPDSRKDKNMHLQPVPIPKFYRLINHGPTVLVSAQHSGTVNAMSASWACALDFDKLTVVLDKSAYTRGLIERSGWFAVQVPTVAQADMVLRLGSQSRHSTPNKMDGIGLFYQAGFDVPLVENCAAWMICKLLPEPHNQQTYDLFIGEVVSAWADERIFHNGRWLFEQAPDAMRTLHYMAGGQFYAIGKGIHVNNQTDME